METLWPFRTRTRAAAPRFLSRFLPILSLAVLLVWLSSPPAMSAAMALPQESTPLQHIRDRRALFSWLDQQSGTVIAMQRELVALPAVNPEYGGIGEEAKLRWVEDRLRQYGITNFQRLDYLDDRVPGKIRGNLLARYPTPIGDEPVNPTLWLISHLDVFPPGPAGDWTGDPFTLRVDGDLMYGRGTEDNHQAIVTSLLLVEALQATGVRPDMDIGLIFCSGALTNYAMNAEHILDQEPGLFGPDDCILIMDHGSPDGAFIEVAEKANAWYKVTVTGREGHAGSPHEAVNALTAGAAFIHALRAAQDGFSEQNPLFVPPTTTLSPTAVGCGTGAVNHIPGEFTFHIDARLIPEHSFAQVEKAVRTLAETVGSEEGVRIDITVLEETSPPVMTPADAPVIRRLSRAVSDQLRVTPELGGIGTVTMASSIRERGFDVAVWGIQTNWRSKTNEHASISRHLDQVKVLVRFILGSNAGGSADDRPTTKSVSDYGR